MSLSLGPNQDGRGEWYPGIRSGKIEQRSDLCNLKDQSMRLVSVHRVFLFFLACGLSVLSGCGLAKKTHDCKTDGDGLKEGGLDGESLQGKELVLAFLEGPSEVTADIGKYLSGEGISGTFFVAGEHIDEYRGTLRDLKAAGHIIGTGGYTFKGLQAAKDPIIELRSADAEIADLTVGNQFWLYGKADSLSTDTHSLLYNAGLGKYVGPIHEDTGSASFIDDEECWKQGKSVQECGQNYMNEIQRIVHGIVAFHDKDARTAQMLELLIPALKDSNFTFTRLDQVPALRSALAKSGGTADATPANESCDVYE